VIIAVNTMIFTSRQITSDAVTLDEVDSAAVLARLSEAVRIPTISHQDPSLFDAAAFLSFHDFLEEAYPAIHSTLERKVVGEYSLLYEWKGTDPEFMPVAILAHMDVVPVEPGTESNWTHGAYEGEVAGGYLWGRGTLDMKSILMASMEAVEGLISAGFRPRRTLYFAFGHDEELGGYRGAKEVAALLQAQGVELSATIDEGLMIAGKGVSPLDGPLAVIGLGEKGGVTLKLEVEHEGGHSSMPPPRTTVGILSRAVHRLESNPMPAAIDGPTARLYDYLVPEMSLLSRVLFANRWLFEGVLVRRLSQRSVMSNAGIRTTTAPTFIHGGVKSNVMPSKAHALVNFRIKPGDTVADVETHARAVIDDESVAISRLSTSREASQTASADSGGFRAIHRTISEVYPDVVVAPGLVLGGTDSRHFSSVAENSYRFAPLVIRPTDAARVHATDERIKVSDYTKMIQFYMQLIRNFQQD
jgi:carboxypeptidase PM20D1